MGCQAWRGQFCVGSPPVKLASQTSASGASADRADGLTLAQAHLCFTQEPDDLLRRVPWHRLRRADHDRF